MKVMLLKDVYKLGRAGDVKKVADGFGLSCSQGAGAGTPGAQAVDRIRQTAELERPPE
jgi:large subunit ribosomal protein L9